MAIHKNGTPARAIAHLQTLEAGTRLSTSDLAAAVGYERSQLSQALRAARVGGNICAEREGNGFVWFLPEAGSDEPEPFEASLWTDGELVIYGAQANEDGSVTLTADQVTTIKRLVSWVPAS